MGPQDIQALAKHIYRSEGPSGLNRDYLLGLDKALQELSPESGDEHVTDLSDRVRAVMARGEESGGGGGEVGNGGSEAQAAKNVVSTSSDAASGALRDSGKAGSVDQNEETEKVG